MGKVKPEDIEAIVEVFDASDWNELRVSVDGLEIFLSKDASGLHRSVSAVAAPAPVAGTGSHTAREKPAPAPRDMPVPDGMLAIRAPNLGTFFKAPKPDAAPFVAIGQKVAPDTEICIIEVMKLFTTVRAGMSGVVREILVSDGQMVEFGQPLILIEPAV